MKIYAWIITFLFLFSLLSSSAQAIVDPISIPNNKFGIHVIDENDLEDAAKLVNSSGGEWGYVTIVIKEEDRDLQKWQRTFDKMRELKLIPLVRLATRPKGAVWEKPTQTDAQEWADFLNNLNWVVQNRYVILFNEPNHAQEWEGTINPREYSEIAKTFSLALKQKSPDFFILPAGFDAAAPNSPGTMDMANYLNQMHQSDQNIFSYFDGWNSHSYPNPGFSGSPNAKGKGTIASFDWEMRFIQNLGAKANLPIFITETGWVHRDGKPEATQNLNQARVLGASTQDVGEFMKVAFNEVWNKDQIIAVTPFVLNYQDEPFDNFSWKKYNSQEYHPQFSIVQSIEKPQGNPLQINSSAFVKDTIPNTLLSSFDYKFQVVFKNNGQSIWDAQDGFRVVSLIESQNIEIEDIKKTKPGQEMVSTVKVHILPGATSLKVKLQMARNNDLFGEIFEKEIDIIQLFATRRNKSPWEISLQDCKPKGMLCMR